MNDYYYPPINKPDNTLVIVIAVCVLCIISCIIAWFVFSGSGNKATTQGTSITPSEIVQKQQTREQQASSESQAIAEFISSAVYQDKNWAGKVVSTDGRCGPNYKETSCPGMKCCSMFGFCGGFKGQTDSYCGNNHGFDGVYDGREP